MSKVTVNYFNKIDGLRFIAAFMVIVYHAYKKYEYMHGGIPDIWFSNSYFPVGKFIEQAILNGEFGVDIFFLLSGFLITFLLITEKEKTGKINLLKFYVRRSLRIWPLFYLVVFSAPFIAGYFQTNYAPVYTNALFINNFWVINNNWWMFPTAQIWSLCIEEHFYIFWPILIAIIPNRKLPILFSLVIFISFAYRGYVASFDNLNWYKLYLHTFSRMDALAIGAFVSYFYVKKPFNLNISKGVRVIILLAFIISFCSISLVQWGNFFEACFKNFIFLILTGTVMFNYLFNDKPLIKAPKIKIINYFGKISYGMYMFGIIVLELVSEKIMPALNIENSMTLFWIILIILSIVIPIFSYEVFEKHFLKLKGKFQVVRQEQPQQ